VLTAFLLKWITLWYHIKNQKQDRHMDFKNLINKAKNIAESDRTKELLKKAADTGSAITKKTTDVTLKALDKAYDETSKKAKEIKESEAYKSACEKTREKAKVIAESDQIKKAKMMASKFAGVSKEKLMQTTKRLLQEIHVLTPVLDDCGFAITDLAIVMSVPPGVLVTVRQMPGQKRVSAEQWLIENPGKLTKFQETVLISIDRAYALESIAAAYKYSMAEIMIEMTVPPRVEVHFKPHRNNMLPEKL
jgi:cell fate (sporulation/competence/biofilm development) regulator YmcA (YheA/YmcA/DUF963 family)